jgi:hypothetical protein
MAHQPDQQIRLAELLLVDAAGVGITRAEALHADELEAVEHIDRPMNRLAIGGQILAGRAEKYPVGHTRNQPSQFRTTLIHAFRPRAYIGAAPGARHQRQLLRVFWTICSPSGRSNGSGPRPSSPSIPKRIDHG